MAGQKFFVYGGGRWREINISTGRVAGWGVVQYLSVRRGRLEQTSRNAVLRGLKALAAGRPTSVHDGPQLSQIRNIITKSIEEPKSTNNECQHHQHCCQHIIHSNTDASFNNILKPITSTVAVQCTISNQSTKVTTKSITGKPSQSTVKQLNYINIKKKSDKKPEKPAKRKRSSGESSDVFNTTDSQETNRDNRINTTLARNVKSSQTREPCKELLISEEDILLIRNFIEHDDNNVFGVDLERFDSDNFYKCLVFYKLNPLVNVERCKGITDLIRNTSAPSESFKDFMKNLGLQSVEEASQVSSNKYRMRSRRKRKNDELDKENIRRDVVCEKARKPNGVLGRKIGHAVRDPKSGRFRSATGLVKGSKSRPASKKTTTDVATDNNSRPASKKINVATDNISFKQNGKGDASAKTNEGKKKYEQAKRNEPINHKNDFFKINREKNDNGSMKRIETEKHDKSAGKKDQVKLKKSDKTKVNDKVISNELNDKENLNDSDTLLVSSGSDDRQSDKREKARMPRLAVVQAKRLYVRGSSTRQPYTTSEDRVLVQWVRGAGRARQVNGNKLWRELQPIFHKKTGRFRSWHSLRNRYLRSLLPTLGTMSIPADEAARLRAAAASGELKSKKMLSNSIYKEKRVISAWSRRPRSPLRKSPTPSSFHITHSSPNSSSDRSRRNHDSDYTAESSASVESPVFKKMDSKGDTATRTLRSSTIVTSPSRKQKQINARTPTYSEVTKRFALKHSTPDSDTIGYNNADKNVRPTRLLRKDATYRQNAESSDDQTKTKEHNSNPTKNYSLNNSKKRARQISTDREGENSRDDPKKPKRLRSVDRQNLKKNDLNNSKKRVYQISTDRQETDTSEDAIKTKRQNSKNIKNNNLSNNRTITYISLIDQPDTDSSDSNGNEKPLRNSEQNSKTDNLNHKRKMSNQQDTDTSDGRTKQTKINLNTSRKSIRKSSNGRQEDDTKDRKTKSTGRHNSNDKKSTLNNSRKRARISSSESEDTDTSVDDEQQSKHKNKNKTINSNKSPNKNPNNRQDTSDDEAEQNTKSLRRSGRYSDKNNSINNANKNKQNNVNKNIHNSNERQNSSESGDFQNTVKKNQLKKIRSRDIKGDTDRPRTRRLFNPNAI